MVTTSASDARSASGATAVCNECTRSCQRSPQKRRWADDAYVEAQARERFGWVMPGETSYQVIDRDGKPLERTDELTDPDSVEEEVTDAWWDKVWGSVETADHPERVETPPSQLETPE